MTKPHSEDLASRIGAQLPYLRRYARALTGSQSTGDTYAAATLEAILQDRSAFETSDARVALFRAFHLIWTSSGAPVAEASLDTLEKRAQVHLSALTPNTREALLLRTVEEFRFDQIADIMRTRRSSPWTSRASSRRWATA
jgi:DNA-directed RNA polymerase specialized sigma24 family protein